MVTLAGSCHSVCCGAGCSGGLTLLEGMTGTEQTTNSGVSLSPASSNCGLTQVSADTRPRAGQRGAHPRSCRFLLVTEGHGACGPKGNAEPFSKDGKSPGKAVIIPPWVRSEL